MAQQQMSLFGPSVYDIQRQQMQQDQANAIQQAQLSPYQGIAAAAAMAGTRAGRSLAGLFGIEDPALSEAKKMEELKAAVASQWDGNDPLEAYKIFAKEASARGLTQAAIGAATQIKAFEAEREKTALGKRKAEAEITLAGARVGQAEAAAKASEAKASAAGQLKPSELGTLQAERDALRTRMQNSTSPLEQEELRQQIAEIDAAITMKTTREAKDKTPPSVGQDREAIAQDMFNTDFYKLTQEQKKSVNERYEKLVRSKTPNINIDTKDVYGFVRGANADLAPIVKQVTTLETALNLLNQQSSPFASRALEQQIASIFGDANKAKEEIKALANTGSLDERIANNILNFLSGTKTDATKADQQTVLRALRSKLGKDYENMATPLRSALEGNKNVDPNKVIPPFSTKFGELPLSTTRQRKTKSGTTYTVED
jgi:hypothetical protein